MRDMDQGWFETKEQKILVLILVVGVIGVLLSLAMQAQLGEVMEWMRPAVANLQTALAAAPVEL